MKEERAGGDDAIRPAFPAAGPSALPGADPAVFRLHQRLIGLRRRHPWLRQTPSTTEQLRNDQYVIKQQHGPHVLRLALNLADQPLAVPPECRVLIADPATENDPSRVAPQGWAVLEPIRALVDWTETHQNAIAAARAAYDRRIGEEQAAAERATLERDTIAREVLAGRR